ncbi:MAG: DinB family protein [Candidatus Rokubacteria bacterium]|nr:DinB family protein [Candidatus Rokubacteria bacterium]
MPFAYYARLSRSQQALYRKSDGITEIRLRRPAELQPLGAALEAALRSEDRPATQQASTRLIEALAGDLGLPPVEVEVLAARPHARWGELHGLYTTPRGRPPRIQLWMRTAKQRRVVAFRTYLRTLLHEVGHHIDYTHLRLPDSLHTAGFYKRESSLFHQLVHEETTPMPTVEEYAQQSVPQRLARLQRTADELAAALRGQSEAALARRPDPKNWAAKEVVCHLRDVEESYGLRIAQVLAMDEPKWPRVDPERWAADRQYLRNDAAEALAAFRRRREETLGDFRKLSPGEWQRAGMHAARGRMTLDDMLAMMAWHDDNHLDQLKRAVEGRA